MPGKNPISKTSNSTLAQRLLSLSENLIALVQESVMRDCQPADPPEITLPKIREIVLDIINLSTKEKWEAYQAHEIGKKIYKLNLLQPDNLSISQKTIISFFSDHLPQEELIIIFPRYCNLTVEIIAGFVMLTQEKLLLEQQQIRMQIENARAEAEQAWKQIEERHNVIVENIPEIIIIIDINGKVVYYHPGYRKPNEKARSMEGINIVPLLPKELYEEFIEASNKALSTGKIQVITTSFPYLTENNIRIFEGRIAPYSEDKTITIVRDITEIIEYQNALQTSQAHLQEMTRQIIDTQETERHQIALDLHDQVLSQLGALLLFVDETTIPPKFLENYHKLIDQIRATIYNLRPPMINYGLYPALDDLYNYLSAHMQTVSNIQINVSPNDVRIDPNAELHIYRIIQEATINACKHSHADRIIISGEIKTDNTWFSVEDNGIGFPCDETINLTRVLVNNHFGMAGMFERAALINAELSITSKPDHGTKVKISWKPKP